MSFEPAARPERNRPEPLDVASKAERNSRRWVWLFTVCAACVGLWTVIGNLEAWPVLVGFVVCAVAARWEASTWRKDVERTAELTRLLESQNDTSSRRPGRFLAI